MTRTFARLALTGLLTALLLSTAPLASAPASAQEAIMLETIGAVRMARPAEPQQSLAVPAQAAQRHAQAHQPSAH